MVDRPNKPTPLPSSATAPSNIPGPSITHSTDPSPSITATLPTGESVTVLLHGATVTSWKSVAPNSSEPIENLWLSSAAKLDGSAAVRGGIPVVFPVFGPPPKEGHPTSTLPQHGFARNAQWEFLGKSSSESTAGDAKKGAGGGADDTVKLDFGLYSQKLGEDVRAKWPFDFGLVYSVTLTREGLETMMTVRNEGEKAFEFQVLLHTYLRVKDITQTHITGLLGLSYTDKVLNATQHTESNARLSITGETDRVYTRIPQSTTSIMCADKPRFDIVRDNLSDTVVWNPWTEKAKAMKDFEPNEGYKEMICVEVGAVDGWTTLEGGETWEAGQIIKSHL
ncbi:galactose mutarotase-like protein [Saccharata proteae CBS 121410]|uniref:Glucose-6-phosphate 1-epimerase n=1 Tax=Saccharata proteae CBS 121410 TaxID=1314787 RepID=A0A9P4I332_9PEZI|nr:galactose mutarotase-like protein [Saccharata proteae CBS 121410]